jgi:lipopolysaccharide biosynthesis protein
LRITLKAAWWAVMPWRIPARLRYLRTPEAARAIELDYSVAVPLGFPAASLPSGRLAAIVHLYYEELAGEFRAYLEEVPFALDVYVSTRDEQGKLAVEQALNGWRRGTVTVRVAPNRGRDIAPKLLTFRDVYSRYDYVLCIHGKQSRHSGALASWRHYLLETLCGSADIVRSVVTIFEQAPRVGLIAAQHFEPIRHWINWGNNFQRSNQLARRMGFELNQGAPLDFPSGSMFWARTASLKPLLDLNLPLDKFPREKGQTDGTPAHAIERLFFYACERAGYDWIKIARPELMPFTPSIVALNNPAELAAFLKRHVFRLLDPGDVRPRTERIKLIEQASPELDEMVRHRFEK